MPQIFQLNNIRWYFVRSKKRDFKVKAPNSFTIFCRNRKHFEVGSYSEKPAIRLLMEPKLLYPYLNGLLKQCNLKKTSLMYVHLALETPAIFLILKPFWNSSEKTHKYHFGFSVLSTGQVFNPDISWYCFYQNCINPNRNWWIRNFCFFNRSRKLFLALRPLKSTASPFCRK